MSCRTEEGRPYIEILIGAVLAMWVAAIAVTQCIPRANRSVLRHAAVLLPDFRFFAPNPASFDYVLRIFVRDIWPDSRGSSLDDHLPRRMVHEIRFDDPARYGFAWNPGAREQKIFRDEVDGLLVALARDRDADDTTLPDWAIISNTYLTCLAIASEQVRPVQLGVSGSQSDQNNYADGTSGPAALALVQFEVLSVTADEEGVVLQSRWHSVGAR